jgi:hypothetical protein
MKKIKTQILHLKAKATNLGRNIQTYKFRKTHKFFKRRVCKPALQETTIKVSKTY